MGQGRDSDLLAEQGGRPETAPIPIIGEVELPVAGDASEPRRAGRFRVFVVMWM
jgi:hypothetical protein